MDKVLTVSVAAYNMERYLNTCLDSLVIPDIVDDLEVFVIDDGGTDRSLEIAKAYAAKYPSSIIPVHKKNGGYGSTVNYSVEHATGKYFKLLDGDDWFDRNGIIKLVSTLKKTDADIVATGFIYCKADDRKTEHVSYPFLGKIEKITEISGNMPILTQPEICIKVDAVRKSGLQVPEHKLYCDIYYQTVPFVAVDTIQFLDYPVVCYRLGREGQSVSVESKLRHQDDYVFVCREMIDFCAKVKKENLKNYQYILQRSNLTYRGCISVLRLNTVCRETLMKIKVLDKYLKETSADLWRVTSKQGGRFIWLMRYTNYLSYWLQILKKNPRKPALGGGSRNS